MALVLDGNGTMTVGNGDITGLVAGALPSTVIGAGAVLQVVQTQYTGTPSWTGTNIYLGLQASITPTSASSKILAFCSWQWSNNGTGRMQFFMRYGTTGGDNSGTLADDGKYVACSGSSTTQLFASSTESLFSAGTTSTLYVKLCSTKHDGGTGYLNAIGGAVSIITLYEIAQ